MVPTTPAEAKEQEERLREENQETDSGWERGRRAWLPTTLAGQQVDQNPLLWDTEKGGH